MSSVCESVFRKPSVVNGQVAVSTTAVQIGILPPSLPLIRNVFQKLQNQFETEKIPIVVNCQQDLGK